MSDFATIEEIFQELIKESLTEKNINKVANAIWKDEGCQDKNAAHPKLENMTIWDGCLLKAKGNLELFAALDAQTYYAYQHSEMFGSTGKSFFDWQNEEKMEQKSEYIEIIKQRDNQWYEEIKKFLPAIDYMSFCGPEATIKWVFEKVGFQPKSSFWPKVDSPAEKDSKQE